MIRKSRKLPSDDEDEFVPEKDDEKEDASDEKERSEDEEEEQVSSGEETMSMKKPSSSQGIFPFSNFSLLLNYETKLQKIILAHL